MRLDKTEGFLKIYFLATLRGVWDLSSPTRDRICTHCIGSTESQPLDCQGSPRLKGFNRPATRPFLIFKKTSLVLCGEWMEEDEP